MRLIVLLVALLMFAVSPAVQAKSCGTSPKASKSVTSGYQITVTRDGGFAPTFHSFSLDSTKLSKADQAKLAQLVKNTKILTGAIPKYKPYGADMYTYVFEVSHKKKTHKAMFMQDAVPAAYNELWKFVETKGVKLTQPST